MHLCKRISVGILLLSMAGCGGCQPAALTDSPALGISSDVDKVRSADYSILFIGNSHTGMHDMPGLVAKMIAFRHPDKKTYTHCMSVGFLEDVARNPQFKDEIESRRWKFVVLQAQKISQSGKVDYSKQEGIDYARAAKGGGADVIFFCEWGLKNKPGDGDRQTKVYQEMATASDARVAPIARAWDIALAERSDMPLHSSDGNHQSAVGAFLTACVLFAEITGESPAALADFPYPDVSDTDRRFLADIAAKVVAK